MLAAMPLLVGIVIWETIYHAARLVIRGIFTEASCTDTWVPIRKRLINEGPSYVTAFFHALIVAAMGAYTACVLLYAPIEAQMRIPSETDSSRVLAFQDVALATESTNTIFLSYLSYDVVHVLIQFPLLGGGDALAHHFAFIGASVLCATYRIFPFPFSWLVLCELSSPFLYIRWYLLTTGRKGSEVLDYTNQAFGYSFLVLRVIMYGCGLVHLLANHGVLLSGEDAVPAPVVYLILTLVTAGYGLQLFWMKQILAKSTKAPKKDV